MRNIGFLLLAVILFSVAGFAYWTVTQTGTDTVRQSFGPTSQGYLDLVREWQPILSVASSIGGVISFFIQVRLWLRRGGSRA